MCGNKYTEDPDGFKESSDYAVLLGRVFVWMGSVFDRRKSVIVLTDQFFEYEGEYYSQHDSEVRIQVRVGEVARHIVGPDGFPMRTRWTLREEDRPHKGWRSWLVPSVVLSIFLVFVVLFFLAVRLGIYLF